MTSTSPELNPRRGESSARPACTGARRHRLHTTRTPLPQHDGPHPYDRQRVSGGTRRTSLQQRGTEREVLPVPEYRATLAHPGPAICSATHARPRRTQSICAKCPAECTSRPSDGLRATGSSIRAETHKSLVARKTFASGTCTLIRRCIRRARRISSTSSLASTSRESEAGATDTRAHLNDQQRVAAPGHRHHPLYLARAHTASP
jgi:hypothetical protein